MANKFYEYRLHLYKDGLNHPEFIKNGGYFFDGSTYVAVIPEESERLYYIPDSLVELGLEDLKSRVIKIQNSLEITDRIVDPVDYHVLNNTELNIFIENWYNEKK